MPNRIHTERVSASSVVQHFPVLFPQGLLSSDLLKTVYQAIVSDTLLVHEQILETLNTHNRRATKTTVND